MQRIRRQRKQEVPELAVKRLKRTRPSCAPSAASRQCKPRFVVDVDWSWGQKLQVYLMASFLYYHMNRSIITNDEYDQLCNDLAAGWKTGKHQHKHLITLADLKAVTGYAIRYPSIVVGGAMLLLQNHCEV